jgi:peptidoglycan/xylan/chitin deacetylase (PgdA/CDA1 family)
MNTLKKIGSNFLRKWNYLWNDLSSLGGLNQQRFQKAKGARIAVYHGICQTDHTRFNSIFLKLKTFEAHLQFYKKYFHVISLDDYYNQRFSKERFNICISFDDGFANNYKYVFPLLNKYQVPAVFFITAIREAGYDILWNDFLVLAQKYGPSKFQIWNNEFYKDRHERYVSGQNNDLLRDILQTAGFNRKAELMRLPELITSFKHKDEEDYWLQMTEDEIKMLSTSPFVTIGCHGYYHNDLSQLSVNSAKDEMIHSKQYLENITGKEINALAFPYGNYSAAVVAAAESVGFTRLLTTDFRFPEDHYNPTLRERLTVNPYISINNQMITIINGRYI